MTAIHKTPFFKENLKGDHEFIKTRIQSWNDRITKWEDKGDSCPKWGKKEQDKLACETNK